MAEDRGDPRTLRRRRWRAVVVAGVVLLVAITAVIALSRRGDDPSPSGLTIGWGGSEGHPSCRYDPADRTVAAKVTIDGRAPRRRSVTVTVTAYADENTSRPVGSTSRSVQVAGTVHLPLVLTIHVHGAPHVGEDDETACRLSVDD